MAMMKGLKLRHKPKFKVGESVSLFGGQKGQVDAVRYSNTCEKYYYSIQYYNDVILLDEEWVEWENNEK